GGAAGAAPARDRAGGLLATAESDAVMRAAARVLDELRAQTTIRRPIRRVMREAAPAIAAIKPIVLASPLSAATMLPPDFPPFDLVVFDEASQVPVWDAACAISRGRASVIVGDSRQLPPTNFFDRKEAGGDGEAAQAEGDLADSLEPLDSLLDEAIASGIAERSLLWHYRSRDERLIEFSNRRSYEGRLQTFPAARRAHANLGVEFRLVKGVYDRGGKATNRIEAEEVVQEVRRRLLDDDACTANRSIGVVTFSEAQQTLVQDLLDEAMDSDERLRERMAEAAKLGEEVFVKNLENVQGDERATMIFSICYGRDASGTVYHNFGPLNLSGGERRLNVAVTRAREKIVIVTSVRASDLDPAKCTSKGARDLRDYLAYAELGTVPATRGSSGPLHEAEPSPAERLLAKQLESRGWRVDLHVGRSRDYRVGLALAERSKPDAWILGVEIDGAFHRAAPTVIDRELVREGVLGGKSGLGWRLMRVSVLDVLRDRDAVVERIDKSARE
ncbi:MAG: AAA domain-containing protein, partial [Phycisphaerales bacterium]